ncbi:MAG: hypothetical protein Q7S31_00240 [bacterium]|nr:hypothetical protein [bacterium]
MAEPSINVIKPKGGFSLKFPKLSPWVVIVTTVVLAIISVVTAYFLYTSRQEQFVPTESGATAGWSVSQTCTGFTVSAPEHPAFVAIADFGLGNPGSWQHPQTFNQAAGESGTFPFTYSSAPPTTGWVRIRAQINSVSQVAIEQPLTPCSTPSPRPNLCQLATVTKDSLGRGESTTISSTANSNANNFSYAFYNLDNLNSPGNPKPICVTEGGDVVTDSSTICPSGTHHLIFKDPDTSLRTAGSRTLKYEDIFVADANNGAAVVSRVQINGYFSLTGGQVSLPQPACVTYVSTAAACTVSFTISATPSPTPTPTAPSSPGPTPTPTAVSNPTPTPIALAPTPTPVVLEQAGSVAGSWTISLAGLGLILLGSILVLAL